MFFVEEPALPATITTPIQFYMNRSESYKTELISKTDKILTILLRCTNTALKIAIITNLVTTFILLFFGSFKNETYGVIILWYLMLFSFWTLILSFSLIIITGIYRRLTKRPIWQVMRVETLLLLLTFVFSLLLFMVGTIT